MALFDKKTININKNSLQLINKRRRQIVVHSYLYYKMNTNLISDFTFDCWCKELVDLHNKYPKESETAEFSEAFKGWNGFSGYDLFTKDNMTELWARQKALQLEQYTLKISK